jgi:hypothetical protein
MVCLWGRILLVMKCCFSMTLLTWFLSMICKKSGVFLMRCIVQFWAICDYPSRLMCIQVFGRATEITLSDERETVSELVEHLFFALAFLAGLADPVLFALLVFNDSAYLLVQKGYRELFAADFTLIHSSGEMYSPLYAYFCVFCLGRR